MHVSTVDQVWDYMRVFLDSQMCIWDNTCMFEIHKWKWDVSSILTHVSVKSAVSEFSLRRGVKFNAINDERYKTFQNEQKDFSHKTKTY